MNQSPAAARPWRPLVWSFTVAWSTYLFVVQRLLHWTCRLRFVGLEHLGGRANFIFCAWHVHAVPYCVAYRKFDRPMMQITNDAWFMAPIHWYVRRMGMRELISMNDVEPVRQCVELLKAGRSTIIFPDGPAGPPKVLKRGLIGMAIKSAVPVVPFRAEATAAWTWWWSWDGKRVPLPFSKVTVTFYPPVAVTKENAEAAEAAIVAAMG